jgi:hypothetical protein
MSTRATLLLLLGLVPQVGSVLAVEVDTIRRDPAQSESLEQGDRPSVAGRLGGSAGSGFIFDEAGGRKVAIEPGMVVTFQGPNPETSEGLPPFRIELGSGQRISGRLGNMDDRVVRLEESSTGSALTAARAGVHAIVQRFGEMQALEDGFERLDARRWTITGDPQIVDDPHLVGMHSLRIPVGGTSLTYRLPEPVAAGRFEIAFHDGGGAAARQQWFTDLLFRGPSGAETVRAVLGWSEDSFSVETPRGPALAVQRLSRKPGWHRLSVRFAAGTIEVAVDGNDLAHGRGPGGPLVEIRLASFNATGKTDAPRALAGHFDDLRLVRFAESSATVEVDPSQDEIRLSEGDQLFGAIQDADKDRIRVRADGQDVVLRWNEVSGLFLRRVATQGKPVEGLLVRAEWLSGSGVDPRDVDQLEGALAAVGDGSLTIDTAFTGTLRISHDRMRQLKVLGKGRRIVLDATAHHLGNEILGGPTPLDPPQPEGGLLERRFELAEVPKGEVALTLDVLQVVGEASDLRFSDKVKRGEIRTNVVVNGRRIDYINRHITSKNETPERIRVPVPRDLLHQGENSLRLEQIGEANDPGQFDDIGVLQIALEFAPSSALKSVPDQP